MRRLMRSARFSVLLAGFFSLPCLAQTGSVDLSIPSISVGEGAVGRMKLSLESSDSAIAGFSLALCFDTTQLVMESVEIDPNDGFASFGGYDFITVISDASGIGVAVIVDFQLDQVLLPGSPHEVAHLRLRAVAAAGTVVPLSLCENTVLSPSGVAVNSLFLTPLNTPLALTSSVGAVTIGAGETFLRGDFNGNGIVELVDAIELLTWGFLGGDPPGCLEGVDFERDGSVSITLDAIQLLTYLFLQGDPPMGPFPDCELAELGMDCNTGSSNCP